MRQTHVSLLASRSQPLDGRRSRLGEQTRGQRVLVAAARPVGLDAVPGGARPLRHDLIEVAVSEMRSGAVVTGNAGRERAVSDQLVVDRPAGRFAAVVR